MDAARANKILQALEATETNLAKLEALWSQLRGKIPRGVAFGNDPEYENLRRQFADIVGAMPAIGAFKLEDSTLGLNDIAQWRFDASEDGEISAHIRVDEAVQKPENDLAEYRFRLRKKRQALVGDVLQVLVAEVDTQVTALSASRPAGASDGASAPAAEVEKLAQLVSKIDRLVGSLAPRAARWGDLRRHLTFGQWCDVRDIEELDWPDVRPTLLAGLHGEDDPVPVGIDNLDALEELPSQTAVPTQLSFAALSAEDFERLVFALVGTESGYENPRWLMKTNAPDRGRDISVDRVLTDGLTGTRRERVLVQCKHWLSRSVGASELATLKEQVGLWEPPRVDVLVIATTGRFSADAVRLIEKRNEDGTRPRIEMWPDSHLELLLARRPRLVIDFGLRS